MPGDPELALSTSVDLDLVDGVARLWPAAFGPGEAADLLDSLRAGIHWQQEEIVIFGQRRKVPTTIPNHGRPHSSVCVRGCAN